MPINTVVIVVEGLATSLVGAYGSNMARTPFLDRMAAQGIVLDQCFLDSLPLETQLASLWTGRHALQSSQDAPSIWTACANSGTPACLITDRESVAAAAEHWGCAEAIYVPPIYRENDAPAAEISQCSVMNLLGAACELATHREGLIWIHSRGMRLPWDAPLELRNQFTDQEDPDPPSETGPPNLVVTASTDPDLIVGWGQVAAAQAAVIDEGIGALLAAIHARPNAREWAWVLASLGGVPLGEHGRLGCDAESPDVRLHGEELSCVALLLPREKDSVGARRGELFQLPDLAATIADMAGTTQDLAASSWGRNVLRLPDADSPTRWDSALQWARTDDPSTIWMRCAAWSATFPKELPAQGAANSTVEEPTFPAKLFVKPEDRWEVSDVANRRHDIVEALQEAARNFQMAIESGSREAWPNPAHDLVNLMR